MLLLPFPRTRVEFIRGVLHRLVRILIMLCCWLGIRSMGIGLLRIVGGVIGAIWGLLLLVGVMIVG